MSDINLHIDLRRFGFIAKILIAAAVVGVIIWALLALNDARIRREATELRRGGFNVLSARVVSAHAGAFVTSRETCLFAIEVQLSAHDALEAQFMLESCMHQGGSLRDEDVALSMVRIRALEGRTEEALGVVRMALERIPDSAALYREGIRLLESGGNPRKVIPILERALEKFPADAGIGRLGLELYLKYGMAEQGRQLAGKLNQSIPQRDKSLDKLITVALGTPSASGATVGQNSGAVRGPGPAPAPGQAQPPGVDGVTRVDGGIDPKTIKNGKPPGRR